MNNITQIELKSTDVAIVLSNDGTLQTYLTKPKDALKDYEIPNNEIIISALSTFLKDKEFIVMLMDAFYANMSKKMKTIKDDKE